MITYIGILHGQSEKFCPLSSLQLTFNSICLINELFMFLCSHSFVSHSCKDISSGIWL